MPVIVIVIAIFFLIIIISFAKKQTNKQTERTLAGTPQQLWPITADTKRKRKQILKSTAMQEKVQLHTTSYLTGQGTSTFTF